MCEPTGNRKWLLLLLLHCADAATKVSSLNQAQSQNSDSARKLPQFDDPQRRHGRARGLVFFSSGRRFFSSCWQQQKDLEGKKRLFLHMSRHCHSVLIKLKVCFQYCNKHHGGRSCVREGRTSSSLPVFSLFFFVFDPA